MLIDAAVLLPVLIEELSPDPLKKPSWSNKSPFSITVPMSGNNFPYSFVVELTTPADEPAYRLYTLPASTKVSVAKFLLLSV